MADNERVQIWCEYDEITGRVLGSDQLRRTQEVVRGLYTTLHDEITDEFVGEFLNSSSINPIKKAAAERHIAVWKKFDESLWHGRRRPNSDVDTALEGVSALFSPGTSSEDEDKARRLMDALKRRFPNI